AMVRMVVQYQKLDESALAEAVAKGHQVHQPGPDMVASVEAFRVSATENIYETVQTRYGIEDAKALIDDFRATYAKWEKLLENVDRDDEAALAELAMQEIYNKLAPDYGIR
ncbi:MAG: C4-dicarboxylate ABC transporter substrate-binding protein, partial [Candidatus Competibacteraceae bacterium]|nr:C4-dicarboxylate ABC transporter substrate-binding protein [Candidatus Competibacteraceae bacterium]